MKPPFFALKHGCPHCGGIMPYSDARCPYCQQEVSWSTRLEWAGDAGKMFIITAGVCIGMLFGWIFFHIPKPNPATGIYLVILIWYVQYTAQQRKLGRTVA